MYKSCSRFSFLLSSADQQQNKQFRRGRQKKMARRQLCLYHLNRSASIKCVVSRHHLNGPISMPPSLASNGANFKFNHRHNPQRPERSKKKSPKGWTGGTTQEKCTFLQIYIWFRNFMILPLLSAGLAAVVIRRPRCRLQIYGARQYNRTEGFWGVT